MIRFFVLIFLLITNVNAQQVFNKLNVKELDVTSRVNVISTTKSSKPCPAMTATQRNAIASPLTGSCVYNTTNLELNIYDGSTWQTAGGGGIENWVTATAYEVDDVVIESNKIYQCEIAHTSGTFATDLSGGNWVQLANDVSISTGVLPIANGGTGNTNGQATINANLTGPITSIGNATSIASQTGTGTKFVVDTSPTLVTPNIGAATGSSLTLSGSFNSSLISALNMLPNGDVELNDVSMFTCGSGNTCSRTTASGEYSSGNAALKVATSAAVLNVSQSQSTPSGIQKQGFLRIVYRIPATVTDAQVCTMVDAAEQTCVPSNRLVNNGFFQSIEVPLVFGSTSVGWKAKTTATNTQNFFFDGMVVGQGLGLQNLQGDTVYSANVTTTTGVVSGENKDFISSCTAANPSVCTFNTGYFTVTPNCVISPVSSSVFSRIDAISSSSISIRSINAGGSDVASVPFNLVCQKQGSDYLAASANVYSQSNADYGATPVTITGTWSTNTTYSAYVSKKGDRAYFEGVITLSGAPTSANLELTLPSGFVIDTAKLPASNIRSTYGSTRVYDSSAGVALNLGQVQGLTTTTVALQSQISPTNTALGAITQAVPVTFATGDSVYFKFDVPIVGWSNANSIVGSFENVPTVPNAGARIDTFSVSYGNAITSACTSGTTCPYNSAIGSGVSVGFVSTGLYLLSFPKTYSKVRCSLASHAPGVAVTVGGGEVPACDSCSSKQFDTLSATAGTRTNTFGTLFCQAEI